MIPGRIRVPKIIPACVRPIRQYISLPTPYFNISKTIQIIDQNKRDQFKRDNKISKSTDKVFELAKYNQRAHFNLSNKINRAREFLGDGYNLNDELITLCLNPDSTKRVQLSSNDSDEDTLVNVKNFELLGEKLVRLQKTLLVLDLQLEDKRGNINGLNLDRLQDRIIDTITSHNVNIKFIRKTVLPKIVTAHQNATVKQKRALALKSLFIMVGCISFSKSEQRAIQFINEKVLQGDGGVLAISINELNK